MALEILFLFIHILTNLSYLINLTEQEIVNMKMRLSLVPGPIDALLFTIQCKSITGRTRYSFHVDVNRSRPIHCDWKWQYLTTNPSESSYIGCGRSIQTSPRNYSHDLTVELLKLSPLCLLNKHHLWYAWKDPAPTIRPLNVDLICRIIITIMLIIIKWIMNSTQHLHRTWQQIWSDQ